MRSASPPLNLAVLIIGSRFLGGAIETGMIKGAINILESRGKNKSGKIKREKQ